MFTKEEESWFDFCTYHEKYWGDCEFQEELIELLNGKESIAMVIFSYFGRDSFQYLRKKNAILGGLSPYDCCREEKELKLLKSILRERRYG